MHDSIEENEARMIMERSFIGTTELNSISGLDFLFPNELPRITYSRRFLEEKKSDYILILGLSKFEDGSNVTIKNLISHFGKDPDTMEPCFYNQDWYNNESFINKSLDTGWYLIRKNVYAETRAISPKDLSTSISFPSAISCTYAFFITWLSLGIKLWYHDFIWCSDKDHNGDRIYVGKYNDIDGINKNGFNIHRHLTLRSCYGCIDYIE